MNEAHPSLRDAKRSPNDLAVVRAKPWSEKLLVGLSLMVVILLYTVIGPFLMWCFFTEKETVNLVFQYPDGTFAPRLADLPATSFAVHFHAAHVLKPGMAIPLLESGARKPGRFKGLLDSGLVTRATITQRSLGKKTFNRFVYERPATLSVRMPPLCQLSIYPESGGVKSGLASMQEVSVASGQYLLKFTQGTQRYSHLVELKPGEVREVFVDPPQFDVAGTHLPDVTGEPARHPVAKQVRHGAWPVADTPPARVRVETPSGDPVRAYKNWGRMATAIGNEEFASLETGIHRVSFGSAWSSNSFSMGFVVGEQQYRLAKGMRISKAPGSKAGRYHPRTVYTSTEEGRLNIQVLDRHGEPMRAMVRDSKTVNRVTNSLYRINVRPAQYGMRPPLWRWDAELTGPDGTYSSENHPYSIGSSSIETPMVWPDRPALFPDAGDEQLRGRWRLALERITTNGVDRLLVYKEKPTTWLRGTVVGGQVLRLRTDVLPEMGLVHVCPTTRVRTFGAAHEVSVGGAEERKFLSQGLPAHLPTLEVDLVFDLPDGGWIEGTRTISLQTDEQGAVAHRHFTIDDPEIRWRLQGVALDIREADGRRVKDPKVLVWRPGANGKPGRFVHCAANRDVAVLTLPPSMARSQPIRVRAAAFHDLGGTETTLRLFEPRIELTLGPRCSILGQLEGEIELTDVPQVVLRHGYESFWVACDLDGRFAFPGLRHGAFTLQVLRKGAVVKEQELNVSEARQKVRLPL